MNCCGDHEVSFPIPDNLIFFVSCSEILAKGDAWAKIWLYKPEYIVWKAAVTYKWCVLFNEGFNQLINVFRNGWIEGSSKGNLRIFFYQLECKRKESILQRIQIVFHASLAFPRETLRYRRLPLLRSGFPCHNRKAEEVQVYELPSACRSTTVSLRPKMQIRNRKR